MINSHFLELILRVEDCIVGKREEREREIMSKTYNILQFHNFSPATKRREISTSPLISLEREGEREESATGGRD